MVRSAEATVQAAKIAELKRLITSRTFESLEMLEDAVDACLWGEEQASDPNCNNAHVSLPG
jgi:hypothetical protein